MRMLMKMQVPVEAGNAGIKSGALPKVIQGFLDKAKPEAAYFGVFDGKRTMIAVFDFAAVKDMPSVAEPFFAELGASIELTPVMDAADLQAGLSAL